MNILVTGANGQLGNEMRILAAGSADKYIFTDVVDVEGLETVHLDITDLEAVRSMVAQYSVDAIVNCAAYTNVEGAEDNQDLAELLNATAPCNLAVAMKERGGLLVHISTDYVFGKEQYNTPCKESMKGTPTGVYGLTKLHGEEKIIASGCKYVIIRTAWLYSEFGKNFVKTMMKLTSQRPAVKVVEDQVGTPTYAMDLAQAIVAVLMAFPKGANAIYHYSNEGVCSWYDFAVAIAALAGNTGCSVQPCKSSEFPSKVVRPAYSVLDKSLIKEVFGVRVPYWMDSLRICMQNMQKNNLH